MSSAIQIIQNDVWSLANNWDSVKTAPLAFEAEAGFAMQILTASDFMMKTATGNRQSVIDAVSNVAAIGISLNPAKKLAYLVPRDGKICLDISYMGLLDMAIESGGIRWGQCRIVFEKDDFELIGIDREPVHKFKPFSKDRGEIVGVYSVVKTPHGDYLTHAMPIDDVFAIRDRSSAWKAYKTKGKSCPWVTDQHEMIKKTDIKQAYKYWPKGNGGRIDRAIQYLNEENGEGIDFDKKDKSLIVGAMDGYIESCDIETQNYLRELAACTESMFREIGVEPAFDKIEKENLDNDQKPAFWSLLPSDFRSALKKEGETRREALKSIP